MMRFARNVDAFVIPSQFTGEESAFGDKTADSSRNITALRNDKFREISNSPPLVLLP
jgi:hypothetical protein